MVRCTKTGLAALGLALAVGACATTTEVDGPTALEGRDLETALNLYGRFDERTEIAGKTFYIWRRTAQVDGKSTSCELRAELGYRQMIRQSQLQGFPDACRQFSVVYTAMPDTRRGEPAPVVEAAAAKPASGCPGCRPVGSPTATAAVDPDAR